MRKNILLLILMMDCALLPLFGSVGWLTHTDAGFAYRVSYPADWQARADSLTGLFEATMLPDKAAPENIFRVEVRTLGPVEANLPFADFMKQGLANLQLELDDAGHKAVRIISSEETTLGRLSEHRIEYSSAQYGSLTLRSTLIRIRHNGLYYTLFCSAEDGYYFDQAQPVFTGLISSFKILPPNWMYLDDYIRVRADLNGDETVFYWKGKVYSFIPGEKRRDLFDVEGYNIVRAVPDNDGYLLLGKEVALWLDYRSGQVLETWRNPVSGKEVPVTHIFNDPTNMDLRFTEDQYSLLPMILPSTKLGATTAWHNDLFPFYPSALPRSEYPLFSQSDNYQAADISQYEISTSDLLDPSLSSLPATCYFTRIYPWFPFMRMGERPGNIIMVCRGYKLEGGFKALPRYLKDYVLEHEPEFAHAPTEYTQPNETIWTSFKKQAELIPPIGEEDPYIYENE
jgi:hypothetical protein